MSTYATRPDTPSHLLIDMNSVAWQKANEAAIVLGIWGAGVTILTPLGKYMLPQSAGQKIKDARTMVKEIEEFVDSIGPCERAQIELDRPDFFEHLEDFIEKTIDTLNTLDANTIDASKWTRYNYPMFSSLQSNLNDIRDLVTIVREDIVKTTVAAKRGSTVAPEWRWASTKPTRSTLGNMVGRVSSLLFSGTAQDLPEIPHQYPMEFPEGYILSPIPSVSGSALGCSAGTTIAACTATESSVIALNRLDDSPA
ncbi:uncharacterized protein FIBRA_01197 [Fibroporia radiculosa]|uniref:Uncharacterized protein n=1 Tax=Fibroporia radiculosa TaxID=599839 RepID=J4HSX4_9APHY|nr:uncharacterized protein FIBRA_01197 [Fibroporia radiculosa]CCL99182.1 predicted protein [Fibroporia radiculosa]